MKRLYCGLKYYWHLFRYKRMYAKLSTINDEQAQSTIQRRIDYHERRALSAMTRQ
ncbi:hypothetical protein [Bacillus sp. HMF5848]|uniref:hypothetical protein n=1 Tax=Bacillus sp. HMF5848 TaxID=2495421 RepID=UPI001639F07F|nr:hypothetical protein [Bacillus sp. HMF5848]